MASSLKNKLRELMRDDNFRVDLALILSIVLLQYFLGNLLNFEGSNTTYKSKWALYSFLRLDAVRLLFLFLVFLGYITLVWKRKVMPKIPSFARMLLVLCVFLLVWSYGLYSYNYYYDQWHFIDRVVLIGLGILTIFRPYFTIFFVAQVYLVANQMGAPEYFNFSFTDKDVLFDILLVLWLFYIVKVFWQQFNWNYMLVFGLAIIGNWYINAGFAKLLMGWLMDSNLYNLGVAAFEAGWLSENRSFATKMYKLIDEYHLIFQGFAMLIELVVPLIILMRRRLTLLALLLFVLFHVGVFLSTGIFFWKWILLELLIVIIIFKKINSTSFYTLKNQIVYFMLLLLCGNFFSKVDLAWLDSGFLTTYTFYLETDNDEKYKLDSSYFAPYDLNFAQGRFSFLNKRKQLPSSTYGSTINKKFNEIMKSENLEEKDITRLRLAYGVDKYDPTKEKKFILFLKRFIKNKSQNQTDIPHWIRPPLHMYQGEDQIDLKVPVVKGLFIVNEEKSIFSSASNEYFLDEYQVYTSDTIYIYH